MSDRIMTPAGEGRFISFKDGIVIAEIDFLYLVKFQAKDCYVILEANDG